MQRFNGREYLQIDIANHMGMDKFSWDDRIQWADNNEAVFDNFDAIAKEPVLFRKAVRALRACDRGEAIGHPMSLDATASGLQILAVLSGCMLTAGNVNLLDTGKREDIYDKVATELNSFTGSKYTRADVKKPIMTVFYGSKKQPQELFGEGTIELVSFYAILSKELPGAMALMQLIQSFWHPEKLEHVWTMPDGHVVRAKVLVNVDKKIEIDEMDHRTFTHRARMNMPKERGLSLAANIVHSLDGYVVREMVRRAKKSNFELATIHDSFWAHPNNMNHVRHLYIQILSEMAKTNILANILNELQPGWKVFEPMKPELGEAILKSNYALS